MSKQEFHYFKQSGNPEIHAAMVGISAESWQYVNHSSSKVEASDIMTQNQFDILPILFKNGSYEQYYKTLNWANYKIENITRRPISEAPKLYYLTQIKDVVKQFNHTKENYFFLSNHDEVVGLITIGNLNCKQFYLYLYSEINSLEKRLALVIKRHLSTEKIFSRLEMLATKENIPSCKDTVTRYRADNTHGFDASMEEYLYLSDVFLLIIHEEIFRELGYKRKELFEKNTGNIKSLRNIVSHPNKSLIKDTSSIKELFEAINKIDELKERIEMLLR